MSTTPTGFSIRLERLRGDVVAQGRRVQVMLEASFEAVFERDEGKATAAIALDDEVDRADVELEKAAVDLLVDATRAGGSLDPVQLREVLTIAKVNNELERVADAAVDVAELVPHFKSLSKPFPETFRVMANSVIGILRDSATSVARQDPALAKVVLQSQHAVTAFKGAIVRDAEERIAAGTMPIDLALRLHEIAGQCELIADHCTNICEQIIYLRTGTIVRHTEARWIEIPPG
jgi:phosphate transport system protein